ncbi:flavin-containing monooxygenase [Phycicoccus duodecadis]|uniref:Cation diffusion facilitator CzcD-associated flavoprotein CzcO n=1 Tax=Phycicoccus duodecadis TaxID=173053 RepID=A0A2N3YG15_9MICO|nr:NAD(P)/FAD-dependent oxidoreductase [Phycicoccus duodecadis]PKW25783.1 cation diffusion facilitator CzcD-associated flavoprotein CzcO [Phycicoccus duodecadis]
MPPRPLAPPPLDVDVLVVGAGLSGIDAACRLSMEGDRLSWAVLEARDATGGTWDLFRYPGVRSDSDMYTLGFPFRPWQGATSIAPAAEILQYLRDTADEYRVTERIHVGQRVTRLAWSSHDRRWTVTARRGDGEVLEHRARFVYLATGYYSYASGHVVDFPGQEDFAGEVVHPQQWPEGLPVAGRRVVVIGSGATAVTLVPALVAEGAEHVTMLQRSPSYVAALPNVDPVADAVRRWLPASLAHGVVRAKNVALSSLTYEFLRRRPVTGRKVLRRRLVERLPEGYPVDVHFAPRYDPWDQRLCLSPDGDLLEVLSSGAAEVVTETIDRFVPAGVRVSTGEVLAADVVVTATGLRLELGGGAELVVDGAPVDLSAAHVYKGCMLSDVPNLALAVGYTNASWTLRADLTARWFCALVRRLDARGLAVAVPRWDGSGGADRPLLDFTSGYVQRGAHLLPHQGSRRPWRVVQSYAYDVATMRLGRLDDGVLELS